ncbi:MAG: ABC transporter permease [Armatimonadetes bacterium]|nr:ABC transporter permease [Armatimonadota bacterium]
MSGQPEATETALRGAGTAVPVWGDRLGRRGRLFLRSGENRVLLALLAALLLLCAVPVARLPANPIRVNVALRFETPSWGTASGAHVLGTDFLGRDVLSRIVYAARYTLFISGIATVLATASGTLAGLLAGYYGGGTDAAIMRAVDMMMAFPVILLVLALVAVLGPSLFNVIFVLALSAWAAYARVIRSAVLSLREMDFVEAARAMGARDTRILWHHLLPGLVSPIVVISTFQLARFILTESAISFLGLGVAPPMATWGGMIGDGRNYLYEAWWVTAFPGAAIVGTVLIFNFLGDAMRDAFDPFTIGRR